MYTGSDVRGESVLTKFMVFDIDIWEVIGMTDSPWSGSTATATYTI